MAKSTTQILLPQTVYDGGGTATIYTVTGNSVPAASYYLGNDDLQTISYGFTNVTGNLTIEASLATAPGPGDWFTVFEVVANNDTNLNNSGNFYQNVSGNFVHMRARIIDFAHGTVQFVKVTY